MKLAILIDYLEGIGGGERVTLLLAKHYGADIYSLYANWDRIDVGFKELNVNLKENYAPTIFRPLDAIGYFKRLSLSNYDCIICLGFYSIHASKKNKSVIWYAYGLNGAFNGKERYTTRMPISLRTQQIVYKVMFQAYDKWLVKNHLEKIVTISNVSKGLMESYYGRNDIDVINPPLDFEKIQKMIK